jgi:DNA-binding Lrp family transcriptional regulator
MVEAYILIQVEVGKQPQVTSALTQVDGVTVADSVAGPYDVIIRVEAADVDALGKLTASTIQAVDGVTRTLTCPVLHL